MQVVLPEPLGTDEPEHLARRDVEADAGEGAEAAEGLHQILDAQERFDTMGHRSPIA